MQKAAAEEKARTEGLFVEAQGKTYYFCSEECKEEFHRHGLQSGASSGADPGPEASSGHGRQVMDTKHAEPADTSTTQEPQHSPDKQTPADAPGDGEHDHD
jgi:YHS domain-containing protein